MSQQCVNSFMDSLEDLIKDSEFSAANFTVNEVSFKRLQQFANHAIHGKGLLKRTFIARFSSSRQLVRAKCVHSPCSIADRLHGKHSGLY